MKTTLFLGFRTGLLLLSDSLKVQAHFRCGYGPVAVGKTKDPLGTFTLVNPLSASPGPQQGGPDRVSPTTLSAPAMCPYHWQN
jgi:hypothetical protein